VGKTELCKALAEFLFDAEDHLIRIDMSEFMEKHSVARLIGAPPGYVGYEEGGHLTEQVRRKPYSVILFDEVEKAHPDVFNVLLQVLDDGRMTDGQGRTVDFKNTVIVMTSNLGSQMIQQMAGSDYQVVKMAVMGEVKTHFRPEFVNRIDEIVVFHALDEKNIAGIARIQLKYLEKRLARLEMTMEVSDAALALIAEAGFDPVFGARPLKRAIQERIENPLSRLILDGTLGAKDRVKVGEEGAGQLHQVLKPACVCRYPPWAVGLPILSCVKLKEESGWRFKQLHRKQHRKCCSTAKFSFGENRAMMVLRNAKHRRKPHAGAFPFILCCKEGLEQVFENFRFDAGAGIGNGYAGECSSRACQSVVAAILFGNVHGLCSNSQCAAVFHRIACVEPQVQ
jgi:hypothetical protein